MNATDFAVYVSRANLEPYLSNIFLGKDRLPGTLVGSGHSGRYKNKIKWEVSVSFFSGVCTLRVRRFGDPYMTAYFLKDRDELKIYVPKRADVTMVHNALTAALYEVEKRAEKGALLEIGSIFDSVRVI